MKHLRKFELNSEYESAKGTLANPSVSYVSEGKEVKYDKIPSIDEVWVPLGFRWNSSRTEGRFIDTSITSVPLADTSELTNFYGIFWRCDSLTSIPLIDTSKGTNFSNMFGYCTLLTTIPLIDTSNGTNFNYMFTGCTGLTTISLIDTSNGTDFSYMFESCTSLTSVPSLDVSNGTDFSYMFSYCFKLTSIPNLDVSKGTNFMSIFIGCYELKEIKLLGLPMSIELDDTKINKDSLLYIINNSIATTDITIRLSSTLYYTYSVDPEVTSALSLKPFVTLTN